jgi:glutamine synthetase
MLSIDPSIDTIRVAWCDLHGHIRSKSMPRGHIQKALQDTPAGRPQPDWAAGMVGTLMLKDTSDRTALKVFESSAINPLGDAAKFANASNLTLKTPTNAIRLHPLPWSPREAWLFTEPFFSDGTPVGLDARRILQAAIAKLQTAGYAMRCGLEIEFGPSQFEAVFDVQDELTAADSMVLFSNGVRQALRRAGYHATFMCRPPFTSIMSSGWHLHQSLIDIHSKESLISVVIISQALFSIA